MAGFDINRRQSLLWAGAAALSLSGCKPAPRTLDDLPGGFTGTALERGHSLRPFWQRLAQGLDLPAPAVVHRAPVVIAGGGMAGLAAARALELAGVQGAALLDTQEAMGGNSQGGQIKGLACPLGAHYLPVPGDEAHEVQDWLEQLGVRQRVSGRWRYDERYLCHSPQERLYWQGQWHEGLLPVDGVSQRTLEQYALFEKRVSSVMGEAAFAMPSIRGWMREGQLPAAHAKLDAQFFDQWLAQQGLDDPHLLWYLSYCCRDDFGAGLGRVSAWAGIHYFASRHGFHAPRLNAEHETDELGEQVLTWPQGNGWLSQQLVAGLKSTQQETDCSVLSVIENASGVQIDTYHHGRQQHERWIAGHCVVALPTFIAARVLRNPPDFLRTVAARLNWAPWLVANIHIDSPLADYPGAEPAWDNVLYQDGNQGGLGYVDAGNQRLDRVSRQPTVLSYYQALGDWPDGRKQLMEQSFGFWRDRIVHSLSEAHADLLQRATWMEITRYGHAMAIPRPGDQRILSEISLKSNVINDKLLLNGERVQGLPTPSTARLSFAHSDWAGYSVLEEAFTRGHHAGLLAAKAG
ncbi:NAD(P)-binding protein [Comamonas sp. Y33R10-2]|uniref:FAD-dependent oxidoreductase n=1 Tax=Comamonas sp. Y33R10-2 TaxID=2853257 RepID=UPI002106BCAB|nr:NAD(P)-binding protein [Comamonas sp. Y33R10-2]